MALDFQALQTEFYARGFSYLNDGGAGVTRAKRWLNDAMHEINEIDDWPFLETSTSGTAPVTVADLRKVKAVYDSTNKTWLYPQSHAELIQQYGDLTITGTPVYYYVTGGTSVGVYPASTAVSVTVYYWKFGTDLSANGDVPLIPDRFRYAIVDYAVARGLRDAGDLQGAADARAAGDALVGLMRQTYGILEPHGYSIPLIGDDS